MFPADKGHSKAGKDKASATGQNAPCWRNRPRLGRMCRLFKVRSQGPKSQDPDVEFLVGVSSWNLFKRDPAQKAPDKGLGRAAA